MIKQSIIKIYNYPDSVAVKFNYKFKCYCIKNGINKSYYCNEDLLYTYIAKNKKQQGIEIFYE